MGHVLERAPVYFAAAQVRHNPITAVSDEPQRRALQDAFRQLGYPDQQLLKPSVIVEGEGANLTLEQPVQLLCMNAARTSSVVIQSDRYWLQTTHYLDFEAFKSAFLTALGVLHSAIRLDYVDSISMRMLDVIVPGLDETLQHYLPKEILGLDSWADERGWKLEHQAAEHVFRTEKHRVVFKCIRRPNEISLPPDTTPMGMQFLERHQRTQGVHAVLDTDAALEGRQDIDMDLFGEQLDAIKTDLSQCFKHVVTPYALEQWK